MFLKRKSGWKIQLYGKKKHVKLVSEKYEQGVRPKSLLEALRIFILGVACGMINGDHKNKDKPLTYISQKGKFISDGNTKILRLYTGNIQIFSKSDQRISEIEFDTYDLDLSPYSKVEGNHRYADELFTTEIYNNLKGKPLRDLNKDEQEQFAEINNRIISPIYLICLSILPLLALNYLKSPNSNSVFPISIISLLALLIKILEISMANLLIENNYLVYFNYFLPLFFLFLFLILIIFDNSILNFKKYVFKN